MAVYNFCLHNNSCSEFNPWSDYFSGAFENVALKATIVSTTIVAASINLVGFYGIIWFERYGADVRRVLLNRLVSSICWTGFEYYCLALVADLVRYVAGPLPTALCVAQLILKNAVFIQNVLFCDAIAIVRYLLYFSLRGSSELQDEFWSQIIKLWIVGFSLLSQFVYLFIPGVQPLNIYICSGEDPAIFGDVHQFKKNYLLLLVIALSIILQIGVAVRIVFHKIKIHESSASPENKINFILSEILVVLGFTFVSSLMSFFVFKTYSMEAVMINFYPNYIYLYCLQTLGPILVGFTICILLYTRNSGLRTTVAKESIEFLKRIYNNHV